MEIPVKYGNDIITIVCTQFKNIILRFRLENKTNWRSKEDKKFVVNNQKTKMFKDKLSK